ncbi:hypothetical protein Thimo_1608 [Thioflavicoccus mobilis 8321]|uniref:Molybdenum carrier n=1 Tax=Thioflavicoccus mobilis 8321 TaxID=765912 RepID=L0GX31_9GAMM|nr:putative molybdenum carrier protein [Thioflavicoccus mobilis]AGA90387.1 hypothetical protein Thimo_1608 [Thioflavicoccus mobilis 8321]
MSDAKVELPDQDVGRLRVVSGGQTGVDRAALDAALALGLAIGGWCPRGRRAEDGPIAGRYPLVETPGSDYAQRTAWNVRDSDATLILHRGSLTGGTALTAELAHRYARPLLTCDLSRPLVSAAIVDRLLENSVRVLNCAGPRESGAPGIEAKAYLACKTLFSAWLSAVAAIEP